jgi:hypothetical protein
VIPVTQITPASADRMLDAHAIIAYNKATAASTATAATATANDATARAAAILTAHPHPGEPAFPRTSKD